VNLTLNDLQALPHIEIRGGATYGRSRFRGVSTDSRTTAAGDVFIALRGERFDGHRFVPDAIARGASSIIVEPSFPFSGNESVPHIVVENSTTALGELALLYRKKFAIPVLAVGGSNGKTTTKGMIARVLSRHLRVLSTEGNLNNQIGVPQTLFRLQRGHDIAVVEIGTNHPGEIMYLCKILEPTHGLVTTIGKEHLEFFGTVAGVAREEGALFTALAGSRSSLAFVNVDDPHVVRASRAVRRRITYGLESRSAEVRGRVMSVDRAGCVALALGHRRRSRPVTVQLRIPGEHNALNALAAAAVGIGFGLSLAAVKEALEQFRPASKRMEVLRLNGLTVMDDTYNANPDSMIAALHTLAAATGKGKRIAVLADMLELGAHARAEHARVGREAARLHIDYVLTYGELAREIHRTTGLSTAMHYEQKNMLSEYLAELAGSGDTVLVKGSRGMRMEDVVTFLRERYRHRPA
jgi:UDP-N-acetylmuramoyl-tripeptide--D-alanyl-D-alanine ligase